MDAKFTGLVRSGRYYTAPVCGKAAHNDRFAPVLGIIELFNRCVKSVKVGMDKTGHGRIHLLFEPFVNTKLRIKAKGVFKPKFVQKDEFFLEKFVF